MPTELEDRHLSGLSRGASLALTNAEYLSREAAVLFALQIILPKTQSALSTKGSMNKYVAACAVLMIGGCANLTEEGAKVRVISAQDKQGCKYLKLVMVRASLGPDKTGQALKLALNETAAAGGDSFLPININQDWFDGASASGEALKCSR